MAQDRVVKAAHSLFDQITGEAGDSTEDRKIAVSFMSGIFLEVLPMLEFEYQRLVNLEKEKPDAEGKEGL